MIRRKPGRGLRGRKISTKKSRGGTKGRKPGRGLRGRKISTKRSRAKARAATGTGTRPGRGLRGRP